MSKNVSSQRLSRCAHVFILTCLELLRSDSTSLQEQQVRGWTQHCSISAISYGARPVRLDPYLAYPL
jgi:hypothetical protein